MTLASERFANATQDFVEARMCHRMESHKKLLPVLIRDQIGRGLEQHLEKGTAFVLVTLE